MNLLIGPRDHWFRGDLPDADRPVFVRPAIRMLEGDDFPFASLRERAADWLDAHGGYRGPLDFAPMRRLYRARRRIRQALRLPLPRLPRIYPRHVALRLLARFNRAIDRWIFDPEGNPAIDRLCYAICVFAALYIIAQIVRAWVGQ